MTLCDDLIAAIEGHTGHSGKRQGRNVRLVCPAHDDGNPSLDVAQGDDGRPLVQCRSAGCTYEAICAAIGREPADFMPRTVTHVHTPPEIAAFAHAQGAKPHGKQDRGVQAGDHAPAHAHAHTGTGSGLTLVEYAEAKRLPLDFLQGLGLSETKYRGDQAVRIPYLDEEGSETAIRFRLRLEKGDGDDRFRWRTRSKPCLYGLNRLNDAREAGYVVLAEGESDAQTLWLHGCPGLGLPGAGNWNEERDAPKLEGIATVYLVVEPDAGGEQALAWLARSAIRERVRLVRLDGAKDVSELHLADPERFRERLQAALDAATPWAEHSRAEADATRQKAWEACAELAGETHILDRLVDMLDAMRFAGEEKVARLVYLVATSRLLDSPVSLAVKGPSSAGKSYTVGIALRFLPSSAYMDFSSMSERALLYLDEPLAHRHLVIYEGAGMEGDFLGYIVRTLLSEGCLKYQTVEKTPEGLRSRLLELEGPTGLITSTTALALEPELETRLLSITLADTPARTRAILDAIGGRWANGVKGGPDLSTWHALQTWLESGERRVIIPFARELVAEIPPVALRLTRDAGQILALVAAHALLHQASRERDAGGWIIATLDDYAVVRELVADLLAEGIDVNVSDAVREVVAAVSALAVQAPEGANHKAVADRLGIDRSAADRRAKKALKAGYLVNLEERRGKPARLVVGEPLPDEREVLPDVERVRRAGVQARDSASERAEPAQEEGLRERVHESSDSRRGMYVTHPEAANVVDLDAHRKAPARAAQRPPIVGDPGYPAFLWQAEAAGHITRAEMLRGERLDRLVRRAWRSDRDEVA